MHQPTSHTKAVTNEAVTNKIATTSASDAPVSQSLSTKTVTHSVVLAQDSKPEKNKDRKRNLMLALIILGLTAAVLLGVLVHNRMSAGQVRSISQLPSG